MRPLFDVIAQPDGLQDIVETRWRTLVKEKQTQDELSNDLANTGLVVTAPHDIECVRIPSFAGDGRYDLRESLRLVLAGIGINDHVPIVAVDNTPMLSERISALEKNGSILIFSWGSVTGLTLRRLKLAVADAIQDDSHERVDDRKVHGLVFHARPSIPSEWTAQQNQFKPHRLACLWTSCFPWQSPVIDESLLLDRSDIADQSVSDAAKRFLEQRQQFLDMHPIYSQSQDDWSPRFDPVNNKAHPEHIFWGMSHDNVHQERVRGRSLYGKGLDCLTAYAAMGSTINYTRLSAQPDVAPRWVMFDMGRIVRSYFDAVITCAVIRWLQPGELCWAEHDKKHDVRDSVTFLMSQAADHKEQVILIPELLLACAQGKVPKFAYETVRDKAMKIRDSWPSDNRYDMARGAIEVGLQLLEDS